MSERPVPGLYSAVHTSALEAAVRARVELEPLYEPIATVDVPAVLARHVASVIARHLADKPPDQQKSLVNAILELYGSEQDVLVALDRLVSLHTLGEFRGRTYGRPHTPLSETSLLTNAPGEPSIGYELKPSSSAPTVWTCSAPSSALQAFASSRSGSFSYTNTACRCGS